MFLSQREGSSFTPIQIEGKHMVFKTTLVLITKINKIENHIIFIADRIPAH
jgi:hypothetical protein